MQPSDAEQPAHRVYIKRLRLKPEEACYCGSAAAFGQCCGSTDADRKPPAQLGIVPGFLTPAERNSLLRFGAKQKRKWLTMVDVKRSTATKNVQIRDPGRVTQAVDMTKRDPVIQDMFRRALVNHVAPYFGAKPVIFEPPYVLRYPPGGKYVTHSDADHFDEKEQRWFRLRDRDVSLLVYLNDDYTGGGLKFDHLNYTYQPGAGDLVFFPSNHRFSHQSLPIESGIKWAIVSWSCFGHTPRVTRDMANWRTLAV